MWVQLDLSGVSLWFLAGLLIWAHWPVVALVLAGAACVGLCSRGRLRVIMLGATASAVALALACMATVLVP